MKKISLCLFWIGSLLTVNSQVTQPPVSIEKFTAILTGEVPNSLDTNTLVGFGGSLLARAIAPEKLTHVLKSTRISKGTIKSVKWISGPDAVAKHGPTAEQGVFTVELDDSKLTKDVTVTDNANSDDDNTFQKVEVEASFAGGDNAWRKYLEKNANSLIPVEKFAPPGFYTVIVQFVVDKEGNISDVRPLTDHGYGMEAEVVRIVRKGPKWTPAMQGGRNVRAYRKQPVTFQVEGEYELSTYKLKPNSVTIVDLKISGYSPEDLHVSVSNGKVKYVNGLSYEITAPKSGMVIFSVEAKVKRKVVELGKIALKVE